MCNDFRLRAPIYCRISGFWVPSPASPTLQAIAVAQQQTQSDEPVEYVVRIHNAAGDHIMTTIDGEIVEEPDQKLIASDRTDGPDA